MSNILIPLSMSRELPFAVNNQLLELPEEYQREFMMEYKEKKKDVVLAYVLDMTLSAHYIYLQKYLIQFLYWFTFGGIGIWWLIDMFRLPHMVKEYNQQIADECLRDVLYKYRLNQSRNANNNIAPPTMNKVLASFEAPKARDFTKNYDVVNLTVENLKTNDMLDFGLKTWSVKTDLQYDWQNGFSEKEFKLVSEGEIIHLLVKQESAANHTCFLASPMNIYAIHENLDKEILDNQSPPNVLTYGDMRFFKEIQQTGNLFNITFGGNNQKVLVWDYFDSTQKNMLRIEQTGKRQFRALLAQVVSPTSFTQILPS
ncbi:MAG: DUF4178 domain-containing protein [Bacteroidetes bacterium]|nr:MAG: DUF4178 domain-containing protein [Bacteroidota bacterium]